MVTPVVVRKIAFAGGGVGFVVAPDARFVPSAAAEVVVFFGKSKVFHEVYCLIPTGLPWEA
ncbi:hypothetical protein [Arthrobacter psychrolactophilus]